MVSVRGAADRLARMLSDLAAIEPDSLEDVLVRQSLVFRASQVSRWLGLDEVRAEVAAGRWGHPHWGVFVAHNGALTAEQERWVCLLCAPSGSALGGLTAASIDGLTGFEVEQNHLIIPTGSRRPRRAGLIVHYSDHLAEDDVHPVRQPRRTRLPRSLVDAASWSRSDRFCRAIILAGVQQRRVQPDELRDALLRRGQCRHRALISESIDDAEGGIASVPEHDFEVVRRRFQLPEPDRQAAVRRQDGRYYLDARWRKYRLAAEIHGTQHMQIRTWDADLDRHNELTADGLLVLQFSSYAVRRRKPYVGSTLTRALSNAGWNGS